jgi:hypothetical protein
VPFAIASAVVFEGMRAGAGTFRLVLDLPARARLGSVAFAEFCRATDLSTRGVVFYAIYGFGGVLLTLTAWLVTARGRSSPRVHNLLGAAVLWSIFVLVFTIQAAPLMWRVGSAPPDALLLAALLDRFTFWTTLRVCCVDLSFLATVAALVSLVFDQRSGCGSQTDSGGLESGS